MEKKEYTDKQLIDATQIAYLDLIEKTLLNFRTDGAAKQGPYTLRELIEANINWESADLNLRLEGGNNTTLSKKNIKELIEFSEISDFDKEIIKNLSEEALDWKIVDIHDKNLENGFYGCVIETSPENAIVAFRGSEGHNKDYAGLINDWVKADFGLFKNKCTEQQKEVERFLDALSVNNVLDKYKFLASTGHSLGGNLASHFAVAAAKGENKKEIFDKLNQVVNFDGPGVSQQYLNFYKDAIKGAGNKIKHYKWSLVGDLLHDISGENIEYLSIDENKYKDNEIDNLKYKTFTRHSTSSLKFSKSGRAIRGEQDNLSKAIHSISIGAEKVPTKLIADILVPDTIQKAIGGAARIFSSSIYQKKDGGIGFNLLGEKDDEIQYGDNQNLLTGMILKESINYSKTINKDKLKIEKGKRGYEDVMDAALKDYTFCDTRKFKETANGLRSYINVKSDKQKYENMERY